MSRGIFITGASGKTGLKLLELMSEGRGTEADVTCLCRGERCRDRLSRFPVRIVYGDASDPESLGSAYKGEETVIHLSSIFHSTALLEACREAKRLIVVSSTGVFSEHRSMAADPTDMAQHSRKRSGSETILPPSTSSTV